MKYQNSVVGLAVVKNRNDIANNPYQPNLVKALVHDALLQSGLGKKNRKIPLADIIQPGMTVMLKPNLVFHYNQGGKGMDCMITHPTFIASVVEEVAKAGAKLIIIGDAPIQGCDWDSLFSASDTEAIHTAAAGVPIEFKDFRRTIMVREGNTYRAITDRHAEDEYVLFDLESDSLLEPISEPAGQFRVTMYDPEKLAQAHHSGTHQYLITKAVLEVDVMISLPKLKTHRKAGITASLKNLVGINGNKDYLPHHRIGGADMGGDCYPNSAPWRSAVEEYLDRANRQINEPEYDLWRSRVNDLIGLYGRFEDVELEGGWFGNDTIWRTVLDLNRILLYGQIDGKMSETPRRVVWSIADAIVCGEGEGPLAPNPVLVGAVVSGGNPVDVDVINAALLRLDPMKIPMISQALKPFRWRLKANEDRPKAWVRGREMDLNTVALNFGVNAKPARGWVDHLELSPEIILPQPSRPYSAYRKIRHTTKRLLQAIQVWPDD